jgi:platelet-activating factor acetylhydrolase
MSTFEAVGVALICVAVALSVMAYHSKPNSKQFFTVPTFMPKLPNYLGKFPVAYVDVETTPFAEFDGRITDLYPHLASEPNGLFFRIFYPTAEDEIGKSFKDKWMPDSWKYAHGIGSFLSLPSIASSVLLYPTMNSVKSPSIRHGELLNEEIASKFPVAIFSHGLSGMRTMYSNICGNLASRGFIVIAIEHADGSACTTTRLNNQMELPYYHPSEKDIRDGETKDQALLRFRRTQLSHRVKEVDNAVSVLNHLNRGEIDHVDRSNEEKERILQCFKSRLDFDNMVLVGHSFGVYTS